MTWEIDRTRTTLGFSVRHMMIHTVRGIFRDYEADLEIDGNHFERSRVAARIQAASVSTQDSLRDGYLTSENFFNPKKHPLIQFKSTSVRKQGNKLTLDGELQIRDRSRPLVLRGTVSGPTGSPSRLSFALSGELEREAYDLVFHGAVETVSIVVGKKVQLDLKIDLVDR
jgi:polyisoprenoid-binding protein YceI